MCLYEFVFASWRIQCLCFLLIEILTVQVSTSIATRTSAASTTPMKFIGNDISMPSNCMHRSN